MTHLKFNIKNCRKLKQGADHFNLKIPTSDWLPADKRQNVRNLLKDYYNSLSKHLVQVTNRFNCAIILQHKNLSFAVGPQRTSEF